MVVKAVEGRCSARSMACSLNCGTRMVALNRLQRKGRTLASKNRLVARRFTNRPTKAYDFRTIGLRILGSDAMAKSEVKAHALFGWWRISSFHVELEDSGERAETYGADPLGHM